MLLSSDLRKILILLNRVTLQASEANDFVALRANVEIAMHTAERGEAQAMTPAPPAAAPEPACTAAPLPEE